MMREHLFHHLTDTTVEEEADETVYWLEVLVDSQIVARKAVERLLDEGEQLLKIVVASINTARGGSR
jgi:four helix bundle protein